MNEKIISESQDKLNNTVVSIVYPLTLRVVLGGVCEARGHILPPSENNIHCTCTNYRHVHSVGFMIVDQDASTE